MTKTWNNSGEKVIRYRACDSSGDCFLKGSFLVTIQNPSGSYYAPDAALTVNVPSGVSWSPDCTPYANDSDGYLSGDIGTARVYIKYAPGHTRLVKPVIFVDGLDFAAETNQVMDPSLGAGEDGIIRYGSNGWDVLTMGSTENFKTPDATKYPGLYPTSEFDLYPQAFDQIYGEGYDIVFVDFSRGADYIQKNGLLLIEAIKQINNIKQVDPATGYVNENIIAGASMGGQIARWALATMEAEETCHETSTYVSFDSPHQGANITLGLQASGWYMDKIGEDNANLWKKLNYPATRQLLVKHIGEALQDEDIVTSTFSSESTQYSIESINIMDYGCLRENYVVEMDALGYPELTRNIAISCGSGTGLGQGYAGDAKLFHAKARAKSYGTIFRVGVWALNGSDIDETWNLKKNCVNPDGDTKLQPGDGEYIFAIANPAQFTNCFGKRVPDYYNTVAVETAVPFPHYDNAPGCYRVDLFDFDAGVREALAATGVDFNPTPTIEVVEGNYQQTFMSTMSTLDIDWDLNNVNMWKDISAEDIIASGLTPFEAYYAPEGNLKHVEMDQGMIDWIIQQLNISDQITSTVLPTPDYDAYNYGRDNHNKINSYTVNNNGTLRVNDYGLTGYLNGPTPNDENTTEFYTAYTQGCGDTEIIVESGGHFILGSDPNEPNREATVHVTEGNIVHIKAGGILRLTRGSQLIVEEGATLIIDDGAQVDLWWPETSIHVKGELEVKGDFAFTGSGFFQFDKTNILTLTDKIELIGQNQDNHRFIRLNEDATLNIGSHSLRLSHGTVEYGQDSQIEVGTGGRVYASLTP